MAVMLAGPMRLVQDTPSRVKLRSPWRMALAAAVVSAVGAWLALRYVPEPEPRLVGGGVLALVALLMLRTS